jgi:hypothetical protein
MGCAEAFAVEGIVKCNSRVGHFNPEAALYQRSATIVGNGRQ